LSAGSVRCGASLAGRRPIPASLAFTRTTFSDHPVVGPRHLGVFLAEPISQSVTGPLWAGLPCGSPAFSAAITLVKALRQSTSRQRFCFPPLTLTAKWLISRLSGGVASLAENDRPCQLGSRLGLPSQDAQSSASVALAYSLRNPSVGDSPVFGGSPLRVTRLLAAVTLVSALRQTTSRQRFYAPPIILSDNSFTADCQGPGHSLRNISRSLLRLAF